MFMDISINNISFLDPARTISPDDTRAAQQERAAPAEGRGRERREQKAEGEEEVSLPVGGEGVHALLQGVRGR